MPHKPDAAFPMVIMGKVVAAHGIRGWLKVQPYTEYLDSLLDYATWHLGDGKQAWHAMEMRQANVHGKVLVAKLEGISDRTTAECYKGLLVAVPRSALPEEEEDAYYWTDLIGMRVENLAQETLGTVSSLMETGANDVLVVQGEQGELLIPFVASVIHAVDKEQKLIRVDWQADYLR